MWVTQSEDVTKQAVKQQFGRHAEAFVTSAVHAKGADLAELVAWLQPCADDLVLDVATGGGHVANALASMTHQVVALDLTSPMLDAAKAHARTLGIDNILYMVGDAEQLPFVDGSFDVVTCRIAPHHFPHPERFVQEVARVLKPGGRFAITDNVVPEDPETARFINKVERLRDVSHVRCAPVSEWKKWLEDAGMAVAREQTWTKTFEFESWVARTADTEEQRRAVAQFLLNADPDMAARVNLRITGDRVESFAIEQWLALCIK